MITSGHYRTHAGLLMALLLPGLVLSIAISIGWGAVSIPLRTVVEIIGHHLGADWIDPNWSVARDRIVWEIRFPRAILGAVVGGGLAAVGAALQAVTRNPLADPYLFGVSSGAAFGAVAVIVHLGAFIGALTLPFVAFAGALSAMALVLTVAGARAQVTPERLILSGVAVSFLFFAGTNFLIFWGDQRAAHSVVFWTLGGLGLARWSQIGVPVATVLCGTGVLWLHARRLNAMSMGDETAVSLGVQVGRARVLIFVVCALVTGVLVAVSGAIGFIGLMVPHVARAVTGADYRRVIPLTALMGAIFLLWVDLVARLLLAPQELPIGMITAAIGGGFFIWLMYGRRS